MAVPMWPFLKNIAAMQEELLAYEVLRPAAPWIGASAYQETHMLFEVAVVQNPTKKEAADGVLETLVLGPVYQIAKDKDSAALKAMRAPEAATLDVDRCVVLVRPFV